MERLTEKCPDGKFKEAVNLPCSASSYEYIQLLIDTLGAYEEAEEQGLLVRCNPQPLEDFIQTKYGYCFYSIDEALIYNLYVHPEYRRCGHSHTLIEYAKNEIKKSGHDGFIYIQANPRENSIEVGDLKKYYESLDLVVKSEARMETKMNKIVFTESYLRKCAWLLKIPTEEGQRLHNEAIMRAIFGSRKEDEA